MRHRILLLVVTAVISGSCNTMYKSGQTPDDVYYSPGREVPGYAETKEKPEESQQREDFSDAYLRMKTYDRNRWSTFDNDYMYWNDWRWNNQVYFNSFSPYPYSNWGVGYGTGWYSGWSIGFSVNYGYPYYGYPYYGYYSPFCPGYYGAPIVVVNPKAYTPRATNLNTYRTNPKTNSFIDPKTGARTYNISSPTSAPVRTFRSGGSNAGSGSRGYYNNNSSSRPRYESGSSSPTRSFDRGSNSGNNSNSSGTRSSSGSSGGSSGGSAPVRSFPRGGG